MTKAKLKSADELLIAAAEPSAYGARGTYFDSADVLAVAGLVKKGLVKIDNDADGHRIVATDKGQIVYHRHMIKALQDKLKPAAPAQPA